jgi:hypothetical protein
MYTTSAEQPAPHLVASSTHGTCARLVEAVPARFKFNFLRAGLLVSLALSTAIFLSSVGNRLGRSGSFGRSLGLAAVALLCVPATRRSWSSRTSGPSEDEWISTGVPNHTVGYSSGGLAPRLFGGVVGVRSWRGWEMGSSPDRDLESSGALVSRERGGTCEVDSVNVGPQLGRPAPAPSAQKPSVKLQNTRT